jgi:RNA polymerase sigma-70 factor, ECF subfamily
MELVSALPKIMRFARALTRSGADADDLVQRTCERALRCASQRRSDTPLESWLFRIMRSVWIDEVRSRNVRSRYVAASPCNALADNVDGERQTEAKLELQRVIDEMLRLPEAERVLLQMVSVNGLTYREVADALGIPIGTVMSRLSRARLNLWARLEGKGCADRAVSSPHPTEQRRKIARHATAKRPRNGLAVADVASYAGSFQALCAA